jgi:hypothetical protein
MSEALFYLSIGFMLGWAMAMVTVALLRKETP